MIDPKTRTLIQTEITRTQNKMMEKALEAYSEHQNSVFENITERELFDGIMKIYNNYTEALIQDIIIPLDAPNMIPFHSAEFAVTVKRLNKGYANLEVKFYSARVKLTNELETEGVKNLFTIGDGAGVTRGLIQASASGVYVAQTICARNVPLISIRKIIIISLICKKHNLLLICLNLLLVNLLILIILMFIRELL